MSFNNESAWNDDKLNWRVSREETEALGRKAEESASELARALPVPSSPDASRVRAWVAQEVQREAIARSVRLARGNAEEPRPYMSGYALVPTFSPAPSAVIAIPMLNQCAEALPLEVPALAGETGSPLPLRWLRFLSRRRLLLGAERAVSIARAANFLEIRHEERLRRSSPTPVSRLLHSALLWILVAAETLSVVANRAAHLMAVVLVLKVGWASILTLLDWMAQVL